VPVQCGKSLVLDAGVKLLAEPLPLGVLQVPLDWLVEAEIVHATEPIGTGMEFALPDCHIRYIVALKFRLAVV